MITRAIRWNSPILLQVVRDGRLEALDDGFDALGELVLVEKAEVVARKSESSELNHLRVKSARCDYRRRDIRDTLVR